MAMIGRTVASLDRIESIVPEVKALGVRHVGYGVTPNDFPTVGAALLWTLEQNLRDAWTPDMKETWTAAYMLLADTMVSASGSIAA